MGGRRERRTVEGSAVAEVSAPTTAYVSAIAHNPRNPREDYADVSELADSIAEAGILSPLGVVRYETYLSHYPAFEHEIGAHDWVVLNGNRRLAAARKAGLDEVPVYVLDRLGREEAIDEGVLIDNIHNAPLPPLMEAEFLTQLIDKHGSQAAVAKRIGKTKGYVSQRVSLLKLTDELKDAVRSGQLSLEVARRIAKVPSELQTEELRKFEAAPAANPDSVYDVNAAADPEPTPSPGKSANNSGVSDRQQTTQPSRKPAGLSVEDCAAKLRREYDRDQLRHLAELITA